MTSKLTLSIYFGNHDSCIRFGTNREILLRLEAERVFRKKHIGVTKEVMNFIRIMSVYLKKILVLFFHWTYRNNLGYFPSKHIDLLSVNLQSLPYSSYCHFLTVVFSRGFLTHRTEEAPALKLSG